MQQLFAASLGFGAVLFLTGHARGAECAARDAVLASLAERYGETRQAAGLASNGALIEVHASRETGTWTITATFASGETCLVASGADFGWLSDAPPPAGQPA
jgi:hypothetical protein